MRRPVFLTVVTCAALVSGSLFAVAPAAGAKPAWSIMKFPNPGAATSVDFESVACPSAKSCFAVGFAQFGKFNRALVEHWNGTKWSVMATPTPAGAKDVYLEGVSCPAAKTCFAVGAYSFGRPTVLVPLIEKWNGSKWSIMSTPGAGDVPDPILESVTCPSTTSCIAVGQARSITGEGLVEHWDGVSWSRQTLAKLPGWVEVSLAGVTCVTTTNCFGVGFYESVAFGSLATLIEHWDGSSWSVVPSPSPTGARPAVLSRVACPSSVDCFSVGNYSPPIGGGYKTLAERWDGATWTTTPSPNPNSTLSVLSDVACVSAKSCTSVGHYIQGQTGKTLVERWNGTSWSLFASPNPTGSTNSWLKSVSCPSATSCFAVGTGRVKQVTRGLIERYA